MSSASVRVDGNVVGSCRKGLLVLIAAHRDDTSQNAAKMADRVFGLRIFNDGAGKMNLSLNDLQGPLTPSPSPPEVRGGAGVLAISNFTLYGETSKNRRPSFIDSAPYERGEILFDAFVKELRILGCPVETGVFGAHMEVELVNDGPVTVILDT